LGGKKRSCKASGKKKSPKKKIYSEGQVRRKELDNDYERNKKRIITSYSGKETPNYAVKREWKSVL